MTVVPPLHADINSTLFSCDQIAEIHRNTAGVHSREFIQTHLQTMLQLQTAKARTWTIKLSKMIPTP
jgi:hypothetical protein